MNNKKGKLKTFLAYLLVVGMISSFLPASVLAQEITTPAVAGASASPSAENKNGTTPAASPEITPQPTALPEGTASPEKTEEPTGTTDPNASASPEGTTDPNASASPEGTADPDASASPTANGLLGTSVSNVLTREAQSSEAETAGFSLIDNVVISENQDGSNPITDGSSISKNGSYWLIYKLISPLQIKVDDSAMVGNYLEKDKEYILATIPEAFADFEGTIPDIVTADGTKVGSVAIENQRLIFKVDEALTKSVIYNATLGIKLDLNSSEIGDSEDITLNFGDITYTLKIEENTPKPPTVEKTKSTLNDDNTITWTITVTNDANPIDYSPDGLTLTDIIGNNHSYVADSFKEVTSGTSESVTDFNYDETTKTISCNYNNNTASAVTTYQYKTKVEFMNPGQSLSNGSISVQIGNTVELKNGEDVVAQKNVNEWVSKTLENWIEKNCKSVDLSTGEIQWEIVVKNNGYDIKDLVIYDYYSDEMVMVGTPSCTKDGSAFTGGTYKAEAGTNNGQSYKWSYTIGDVSGDSTYVLAYTTKIDNIDEYLQQNHDKEPENKAWFNFKYPQGSGEDPIEVKSPTINVTTAGKLTASVIEKKGIKYDAAKHQIEWEVTVNPNKTALSNAKVIETIGERQEFISISKVELTDKSGTTSQLSLSDSDITKNGQTITFNFGNNLSEKTAKFTIITELTDSADWATNKGQNMTNDIKITASELGSNDTNISRNQWVYSQVINKWMDNFDYSTHIIPCTIEINQNLMEMTNIRVEDKLGDYGLELVTGTGYPITLTAGDASAAVTLTSGTAGGVKPYYSYENGVLNVYLEDISGSVVGTNAAKKTIKFYAKVSDEKFAELTTASSIKVTNKATLYNEQRAEGVEVSAPDKYINGVPLSKNGVVNGREITYTIGFNQMLTDVPSGTVLQDKIPAGLQLDITSVVLYEATVDSYNGSLTKKAAVTTVSPSVSSEGEKTVLSMSIPEGKKAYILEYKVLMTDISKAPFNNEVSVMGYVSNQTVSDTCTVSRDQFSEADLGDLVYAVVTKVEKGTTTPLEGAVFALMQGTTELARASTNVKGEVSFAGLTAGGSYTIIEVEAPDGYILPDNWKWSFTAPSTGGILNAITCTVENEKKPSSNSVVPSSSPSVAPTYEPDNTTPNSSPSGGSDGGTSEAAELTQLKAVLNENGDKAAEASAQASSGVPKTADESHTGVYVAVLIGCLVGLSAIGYGYYSLSRTKSGKNEKQKKKKR